MTNAVTTEYINTNDTNSMTCIIDEFKCRIDGISRLMISNARNHRPVHPLVYAKYIQDIIDEYNNYIYLSLQVNSLREFINRIRSHISYNVYNMESKYSIELNSIINSLK